MATNKDVWNGHGPSPLQMLLQNSKKMNPDQAYSKMSTELRKSNDRYDMTKNLGYSDDYFDSHQTAAKALSAIQGLMNNNPIGRAIQRSSEVMGDTYLMSPRNPAEYTNIGNGTANAISDFISQAAGMLGAFKQGGNIAMQGGEGLARMLPKAARVASKAPQVLKSATQGAATAGVLQAQKAAGTGKAPTAKELAKELAFMAGAGAGGNLGRQALQKFSPYLNPIAKAAIGGASAALAGTSAALSFEENKGKAVKEMAPQILAGALQDVITHGAAHGIERTSVSKAPSYIKTRANIVAKEHGIPEEIFQRLVEAESSWNPKARSSKGAIGLTQIMPETAKYLGYDPKKLASNPNAQLVAGAKYLKSMYDRYGDWERAVAAYNAGPGNIDKGIMPEETINYVDKVMNKQTPEPIAKQPVPPTPKTSAYQTEILGEEPLQDGSKIISYRLIGEAGRRTATIGPDNIITIEDPVSGHGVDEVVRPGNLGSQLQNMHRKLISQLGEATVHAQEKIEKPIPEEFDRDKLQGRLLDALRGKVSEQQGQQTELQSRLLSALEGRIGSKRQQYRDMTNQYPPELEGQYKDIVRGLGNSTGQESNLSYQPDPDIEARLQSFGRELRGDQTSTEAPQQELPERTMKNTQGLPKPSSSQENAESVSVKTVYHPKTYEPLEIINDSDPGTYTVRNSVGSEYKIGKQAVLESLPRSREELQPIQQLPEQTERETATASATGEVQQLPDNRKVWLAAIGNMHETYKSKGVSTNDYRDLLSGDADRTNNALKKFGPDGLEVFREFYNDEASKHGVDPLPELTETSLSSGYLRGMARQGVDEALGSVKDRIGEIASTNYNEYRNGNTEALNNNPVKAAVSERGKLLNGFEKELSKNGEDKVKVINQKKTLSESDLDDILKKRIDDNTPDVSIPAGASVKIVKTEPPPTAKGKSKYSFTNSEVEDRFEASNGVQKPQKEGIISYLKRITTRDFPDLDNLEYADERFQLRKFKKAKEVAADKTIRNIQGITAPFNAEDQDLFRRSVILNDLAEYAKDAEPGQKLPFGFTPETLTAEKERFDDFISKNPKVAEAINLRRSVWKSVVDNYIKSAKDVGFDVEDRFKNEDYFRHIVLSHASNKGISGTGERLSVPTGRGFLKGRNLNSSDYNTNYLESEYEVMSQMLHDTEAMKLIKYVGDKRSITSELEAKAQAESKKTGKNVDWHDLIPETHTVWQPRQGNVFYFGETVPERLAKKLAEGTLSELSITADDLQKKLMVGGKRQEMVIPKELAATLDKMTKVPEDNAVYKVAKNLTRPMKTWLLFSPARVAKYELRNISSDTDAVIAGNPGTFKRVPEAVKQLVDNLVGNKSMTNDLKDFFERGGMSTGLSVQELGEINNLKVFKALIDKHKSPTDIPADIIKGYFRKVRISDQAREATLRYSAYLDYLRQMESNGGRPKNFGASNPEEVMAISDVKDRAFKLANDLLGAYDETPKLAQDIADVTAPFFRFQAANFKRYTQLFKNAARDGNLAGKAGQTLARKTLGVAVRSPLIAARIGGFAIKASALTAMLTAYNNTVWKDEEKKLPRDVQNKVHIITGKNSDGSVRYLDRLGSVSDFLEWFGADQSPKLIRSWLDGKMSLKDVAKEMAWQPINKTWGLINPVAKSIIETATGRQTYPDLRDSSRIRDRGEYLARTFGIEPEYEKIMGLPSKPYKNRIAGSLYQTSDPDEAAYYDILDMKAEFLKSIGKPQYQGEGTNSPKSSALYNLKKAMKYKDRKAVMKYLGEYVEAGGDQKGLAQSISYMDPLKGLYTSKGVKAEGAQFINSLSAEDKELLARALKYYDDARYALQSINLGAK